jgi:hypothetical protein
LQINVSKGIEIEDNTNRIFSSYKKKRRRKDGNIKEGLLVNSR